jgi:PAS domain S-box-containing protein
MASLKKTKIFGFPYQNFSELLDNITDGFFALDKQWRFTYANCTAKEHFKSIGFYTEDLIGKNIWGLAPHLVETKFYNECQIVVRDQVSVQFKAPSVDNTKWLEVNCYLVNNGLYVFFRDITEWVLSVKVICDSAERYHHIFDNSLDGILLSSPEGTIFSANPSACNIFGRIEEELCTVGTYGIFDFNDPMVIRAFKERDEAGSFFGELTLVRKDGTKFPGEVTLNLFKDKNGIILTSMIIRDITKRKNKEALHWSEEFSKFFYNNQAGMAISRLRDNRFIYINKQLTELLGYEPEEVIDKSVFELNVWAEPKERQDMLTKLLINGYISDYRNKFRKKSGQIGCALSSFNFLDIGGEKCLLTSIIELT